MASIKKIAFGSEDFFSSNCPRQENALSPSRLAELDAQLAALAQRDALANEAEYVSLFDRGRATSLHLFEHVHGDSRDRGPAMIDLAQTYEKAGLYLAEACLLDVRCHDGTASDGFARSAREFSNCPSGAEGGDLGWLTRDEVASELARELLGQVQIGVLPRLVHSRFGLHVVEVLAREPGVEQPFASVRGAVAMTLRQQSFVTALRQYLQLLAGQARMVGVELDAVDTPLVQ